MSVDSTQQLIDAVKNALESNTTLCIQGGNTKHFYGREPVGEPLSTAIHHGVVNYEPSELVITARSGTLLTDIESILAEHKQMLAFEPPAFGTKATLGGTIACGLSGPRRPYAGPARDFVLGVRMINGRGEDLKFGGQVMKNVAGYDVSRLMVGSLGTLGMLLDVSLKILPAPVLECTLVFELGHAEALDLQNTWAAKSLPISATCHANGLLHVRLSGSEKGVRVAQKHLGGEEVQGTDEFWCDLKEHRHEFFKEQETLWRISVPPATPPLDLAGDYLIEWSGALRWLRSDAPPQSIRTIVDSAGGHATLFRSNDRKDVFHPLHQSVLTLHRNLKTAFDPAGIFNLGRMYEGV